ncbi:MAG: hypothetical protein ACJ786_02735 [Catenulispora sp.]
MPMRKWAVIAAVLSLAGIAPTAYSAADVPALTLSKEVVPPGEWVAVSGRGFPAAARLQIEVCGVGGSSNSCAIADAAFATTDAFGGFHQNLRVTEPPTPCPCVVHAAPYAGTAADPVDAPLGIPGLRYLPRAAPVVPGTARLLDAGAVGDSSFLARIGADGSLRVTLTFGNLSGGPVGDPGVALTLSHDGKQVGRYPVTWTGGALPVGQRRVLVYELPLPGGWFRDYEVGVVLGKATTVRTLSGSVHPWGELMVPGTLALGLLCLFAGTRGRHRPRTGRPVREGAAVGRRTGAAGPEPFSIVEPATLGIVCAPELEHATVEALETSEKGGYRSRSASSRATDAARAP